MSNLNLLVFLCLVITTIVFGCNENTSKEVSEENTGNRLTQESSPYLQQHANNPVDWWPWSEAAFAAAKATDRPVIVSIGYSTCHWCHVMEEESFEDPEVAAFMNEHFISIKVDREERPDIDQFYLAACQAITGRGGWPLNAFLLPDARPFYAGTYFPPTSDGKKRGWLSLLKQIAATYQDQKKSLEAQATQLTQGLAGVNSLTKSLEEIEALWDDGAVDRLITNLNQVYDTVYAGFGDAAKFPKVQSLELLLDYGLLHNDEKAKQKVFATMDTMLASGLYDHIGGGFYRYTVDREWRIPHYEKMLYDNAQLLKLLSKLQMLNPNPQYASAIAETINWISTELGSKEGAFYAALDADTEGEEGKFYQWQYDDLRELLSTEELSLLTIHYGLATSNTSTEQEPYTIHRTKQLPSDKTKQWNSLKEKLYLVRNQRIRPERDEKIILQWNALAISGLCHAYRATGQKRYLELATTAYNSLKKHLYQNGKWYRSYTNEQLGEQAFLSDLSALNEAKLDLFDTNFELDHLLEAGQNIDQIISTFERPPGQVFPRVPPLRNELPVQTLDIYDNALPSGNSQMVSLLRRFSAITGQAKYQKIAKEISAALVEKVVQYPESFAGFGRQIVLLERDERCLVISGPGALQIAKEINHVYYPDLGVILANSSMESLPILLGKHSPDELKFYLCENQTCRLPVSYLEALNL